MKYDAYDVRNPNKGEKLEVYKIQVALFGGPGILIYNEDRTQEWEDFNPNNVNAIREFIGIDAYKAYACGYQDKNGKIILVDTVPEKEYWFD